MTLPLVFTILLILGLGSYSLMSEMISLSSIQHVVKGSQRADRGLRDRALKRSFSELVKTEAKSEPTEKKESKSSISREVHSIRRELSKLDIKPLFKNRDPEHFAIASRLIQILYQGTRIEPEIQAVFGVNYGEAILEILLKEEAAHLEDLLPESPKERPLLYKLMRGTSHYTLHEKGIPALSDFLSLRGGESPIHFLRASPALLEALFGNVCATAILEAEIKKGEGKLRSLKKDELETLLQRFPEVQKRYLTQSKLLHFGNVKGKKELIFVDSDARIERRKPI